MTGRPSDFTDEIATRICDLLMDGLSMRSICQADDMTHDNRHDTAYMSP